MPEEDVDHFESDLFEVKQNLEPQPGAGAENHPRVLYRRLETPVHEQIMRGEAGLPRRVTPVGGPGTRDSVLGLRSGFDPSGLGDVSGNCVVTGTT